MYTCWCLVWVGVCLRACACYGLRYVCVHLYLVWPGVCVCVLVFGMGWGMHECLCFLWVGVNVCACVWYELGYVCVHVFDIG